jgi:tetratricopeptide (TPR) repeat protein
VVALPIEQRAKLAYATRQFDVALDLYEILLTPGQLSASDLDLGGHLDDYLELAIRVQRDLPRAGSALASFAKRDDLSPALRREVAHWIAALARLPEEGAGSPVTEARAVLSRDADRIGGERDVLVEYLEASGLLHRALEGGLPREKRAEAYYLLGMIETRIGHSYWLSQAEAYLETAIRLAPGEPIASEAYALLDEFLVAGYSGSGGTHVPADIQAKLDRLRRIAEPADV